MVKFTSIASTRYLKINSTFTINKQITINENHKTMRIAVLADDLTGALDTGVQFTQWGYTVQLTNIPEGSTAEVTIINTDTRNKTPKQAYDTTYKIASKLDQDVIYKKTDSTLRGNPGPEIRAILKATCEPRAILSPTYPSTRRRVKDGHIYVADKPITETEYVNEYRTKTSYIPEILDTDIPIHVAKNPTELPDTGIIVIDSETEQELLKIASQRVRVFAGSAGLADALCQVIRDPPPVLTVIGSVRAETRIQSNLLQKRTGASLIPLDIGRALGSLPQTEALRKAENALRMRNDVIVTSALSQEVVSQTLKEARILDISLEELETKITDALAEVTKQLLHHRLSGIIITGGATALAITEKLRIESIEILDEVQPGVPVIRLDQIQAVTKAGGFGQPDILIQATKYLKRRYY